MRSDRDPYPATDDASFDPGTERPWRERATDTLASSIETIARRGSRRHETMHERRRLDRMKGHPRRGRDRTADVTIRCSHGAMEPIPKRIDRHDERGMRTRTVGPGIGWIIDDETGIGEQRPGSAGTIVGTTTDAIGHADGAHRGHRRSAKYETHPDREDGPPRDRTGARDRRRIAHGEDARTHRRRTRRTPNRRPKEGTKTASRSRTTGSRRRRREERRRERSGRTPERRGRPRRRARPGGGTCKRAIADASPLTDGMPVGDGIGGGSKGAWPP